MRIGFAKVLLMALLAMGGVTLGTGAAVAQNPDTMMPEASATKAKQLLAQMLDAMGGPAYLHVRESQCVGRVSQFGHNNDLTSYLEFKDYWRYPDKNRTDYGPDDPKKDGCVLLVPDHLFCCPGP